MLPEIGEPALGMSGVIKVAMQQKAPSPPPCPPIMGCILRFLPVAGRQVDPSRSAEQNC